MIKVCHIITGLGTGGAENMLQKLLLRMDRRRFDNVVISLTEVGPIGDRLKENGVMVHAVSMNRPLGALGGFKRLNKLLKNEKPDLVQTWMYHADLIGGIAAKWLGTVPVVWNIRNMNISLKVNKAKTVLTILTCAGLSRVLPQFIVANSFATAKTHTAIGYDQKKIQIIPNGFDPGVFKPDAAARNEFRKKLRIKQDEILIGSVARFDPNKDHPTFIAAAKQISKDVPNVRFAMIGDGMTMENPRLGSLVAKAGLENKILLLGGQKKMDQITPAFDIATSSSIGESFSNAIGEAMCCAVPCVVTDVGDSAYVVGDTGVVVPHSQPDRIASAWQKLIDMGEEGRNRLGRKARERIRNQFSLPSVVSDYELLYSRMVGGSSRPV